MLDHGFLKIFFLRIISRFSSYRADAMIDFVRPASSYFDFTFWAFPSSRWAEIVPAYLRFCERFQSEHGFRPALPTEVYFIRKDDAALLSFCPDEDIFTLDLSQAEAVSQVIGFMSLENGLILAAVGVSGMPLVVEMSVAFAVMVAFIIFGIFFFQIRERFDTLDLHYLESFRGERS